MEATITEHTETTMLDPMEPSVLEPPDFDKLLSEARAHFEDKHKPKYTYPEVLGTYRAVKRKPGLYMRPLCLEVEMTALKLFEEMSDGTLHGLARINIGVAAAVLYRVNLPTDETEARDRILGYVRGDVTEEQLFVPLDERDVMREFLNTDELSELVCDPLNINLLKAKEDKDPNS